MKSIFLYGDLARWGFGFHNPNHAAALICMALPFLWGWRKHAWLGWLLCLPLAVALALTYSRTGALVAGAELAVHLWRNRTADLRARRLAWCGVAVLAAVLGIVGVFGRFGLDAAVTNRPRIWLTGLRLAAANPTGVGLGRSGAIASAFLLEGIECRTLVNSHLTLLAEAGWLPGALWLAAILYALLRGWRRAPAAWCAFAGMAVSAGCSSVFDWTVLADARGHGGLGLLNWLLAWISLAAFLGLGLRLAWGRPQWRRIGLSATVATVALAALLPWRDESTPRVRQGCLVRGDGAALVLLGNEWSWAAARPLLPRSFRLPLDGAAFQTKTAGEVWLFGSAAGVAPHHPEARLVFVSPPQETLFPQNTTRILAERFSDDYETDLPVEYYP